MVVWDDAIETIQKGAFCFS